MGMYTKFNVILPIAQDTPKDILERIKNIMNGDDAEFDFVLCDSFYFTGTNNSAIKYPFDWRDDYETIVLHIDCDSKDYDDEQQKFLKWICPYIDDRFQSVDSIVLLPTKRMDSSGYRIYEVIPCYYGKPLGKLHGYDTFSIIMESKHNGVGIDCLRCGLMRIFLPNEEYIIDTWFYQIVEKVVE